MRICRYNSDSGGVQLKAIDFTEAGCPFRNLLLQKNDGRYIKAAIPVFLKRACELAASFCLKAK
jgi:hypothetical protein